MSVSRAHHQACELAAALRERGYEALPDRFVEDKLEPKKAYGPPIRRVSGTEDLLVQAGLGHLVERARTRPASDGADVRVWVPSWAVTLWTAGSEPEPLYAEKKVAALIAGDPEIMASIQTTRMLGGREAVQVLVASLAYRLGFGPCAYPDGT